MDIKELENKIIPIIRSAIEDGGTDEGFLRLKADRIIALYKPDMSSKTQSPSYEGHCTITPISPSSTPNIKSRAESATDGGLVIWKSKPDISAIKEAFKEYCKGHFDWEDGEDFVSCSIDWKDAWTFFEPYLSNKETK
jgi:hypothetical protein